MDIDHFKQVNDCFGHAAGDEVLKRFAVLLRQSLRSTDVYARIGGEEFAAILPQAELEQALGVMQRFRCQVERCPVPLSDGGTLSITVSIGVCSLAEGVTTLDQWLSFADAALYEAKRSGRNCISVADAAAP